MVAIFSNFYSWQWPHKGLTVLCYLSSTQLGVRRKSEADSTKRNKPLRCCQDRCRGPSRRTRNCYHSRVDVIMLSCKPSFSVRSNFSSFSASVSSLWFRHCFVHASIKVDCLLGKHFVHRPMERETTTQKSKHTTTHPHTQTQQWTVLQWKCHRSQSIPSILRKPFQSLSFNGLSFVFPFCFDSKEIFPDQKKNNAMCWRMFSSCTLYFALLHSRVPQYISLCGSFNVSTHLLMWVFNVLFWIFLFW